MPQTQPQKPQEFRCRSETACSSNSSCCLQKKKSTTNPLATSNYRTSVSCSSRNHPVRQRVLSAKLLKMRSLQNQLNDANFHLAELMRENQALTTLQKRHEKALTKYEGTNAELPQILQAHEGEIRCLTEKNKQLKKTIRELSDQLKYKNDEINNLQMRLKHFENLDKDKHLLDREKLLETIDDYKTKLQRADEQVVLLNRKLQLETKSCKQKLNAQISKHKQCQRELERSREEISKLSRHQRQPQSTLVNGLKSSGSESSSGGGIKLEPIKNTKSPTESPQENRLISRPNSSIKLEKIIRESPRSQNAESNKIEQLTRRIEAKTSNNELDKRFADSYLSALDSLKTCNNAIIMQKEQLEFKQNETEKILESVRDIDGMETKLKSAEMLSLNSEDSGGNNLDLITKIFEDQLNFQNEHGSKGSNDRKEPSVGLEERRKLLATLRAIDNGEYSFDAFDNKQSKLADFSDSD